MLVKANSWLFSNSNINKQLTDWPGVVEVLLIMKPAPMPALPFELECGLVDL